MRPYESMIIFRRRARGAGDRGGARPARPSSSDRAVGSADPIDRWGKRAFAYEMRHRREGYYVVMEFTAEPAVAAEIDRLLDLADEVLRHKTVRLPESGSSRTGRKSAVKAGPAGADAAASSETN